MTKNGEVFDRPCRQRAFFLAAVNRTSVTPQDPDAQAGFLSAWLKGSRGGPLGHPLASGDCPPILGCPRGKNVGASSEAGRGVIQISEEHCGNHNQREEGRDGGKASGQWQWLERLRRGRASGVTRVYVPVILEYQQRERVHKVSSQILAPAEVTPSRLTHAAVEVRRSSSGSSN